MRIPLIEGSKIDLQAEWRSTIPTNMVAFEQGVDGDVYYLRTLDGVTLYSQVIGEDRGGIWAERFNLHMRVSGDKLIIVDQLGVATEASATSIAGSGQVQFATSFNSVAFVANGEYYRYDPVAETLTQITKPVGAGYFLDIQWMDGYYILNDSENLWATDIADETTISSINYAGSDFTPDKIVALGRSTDNKLMVFNRYTTERFVNNAGPQFPFARLPNAAVPIGITGPKARASIGDGAWAIFGGSKENSPTFYIMTNSYQKISNGEIDTIIDSYSDFELTGVHLESRDTRDQRLLICHLPRHTLVYDVTLSARLGQPIWYSWKSGNLPWRGINGVYDPRSIGDSASAWIYGDKQEAILGRLDTSKCTQYGEDLEWFCTSPLVVVGGTIAYLEVLSAPGHTRGNPKIFMSTTADGVLYGPEVIISTGAYGDYSHRIIERRLGDYPLWFGVRFRGYSNAVTSLAALEINGTLP